MRGITKIAAGVAVASAMVVGVALPSMAQRRGPRAQSAPAPAITCPMYGPGGWWTRAKPTDPEAASLVQTLTELHNTLLTQRQELAGLLATNADQSAVAAKQAEIAKTMAAMQATNAKALQIRDKLGLPAGVGIGPGAGMGFGRGMGMGIGLGAGMGWGGWWTRVTPQTDAEKAFVQRITELHQQVRTTQLSLRTMIASNADPKAIADQQAKIASTCSQIQKLMADNAALLQRLAGTATAGPGWGMGFGRGMGRGRGMGFGRGMGMNPWCPYAAGATQ